MSDSSPVLAVTPGEPAGVGPEILLRYCRENPSARIIAVADPELLQSAADAQTPGIRVRAWLPGMEYATANWPAHPLSWPKRRGRAA